MSRFITKRSLFGRAFPKSSASRPQVPPPGLVNSAAPTTASNTAGWSLDWLQALDARGFEALCAAYFQESGITSQVLPKCDEGVYIRVQRGCAGVQPATLVRCHPGDAPLLELEPLRGLRAAMLREGASRACLMARGRFSEAARAYARRHDIHLVDGPLFLTMLRRLPDDAGPRLIRLAECGEASPPACPGCGASMLRRSLDRVEFWGCRNFPVCRHTLSVRRAV